MEEDLKRLFSSIMEDNKQRILRICRIYAYDNEDQKDLYQEVAMNIWKSLPSYRKESSIDTWVYRVSLNVSMQYAFKTQKSKQNRVHIEGINIHDENADLHNDLETMEKKKRMYECISKLTYAEKSLILLFLEDLPYKSISDVKGISENHVAVKLARIKKKLTNCINH